MSATRQSGFLGPWIGWVTLGEAVGFTVPVTVGVLTADSWLMLPLLLVAGAVEGAMLGGTQYLVLRRELHSLSAARWITATALAAAFAYLIGLLPSTFAAWWPMWHPALVALAAACAAIVLLASIGTAQWWELRRHVPRAGWWILGTAAGWLVGLGVFLAIATPLWQEGQPIPVAVLIGVIAGVCMAASMAVVTGLVMRALLARRSVGH